MFLFSRCCLKDENFINVCVADRVSYLDGTNYVNDEIMIGIDLLDLRFLATELS